MDVKFTASGSVQVVEIQGSLNDQEMAAIKFKLSEKVNQGRNLVLFDLAQVPFNQAISLLEFTINLGVATGLSGVPLEKWADYKAAAKNKVEIYRSQAEGVIALQALPAKTQSAAKPKTEQAIRAKELDELIKKYDIFQHEDDYDPFRLEFWLSQYQTTPSYEALSAFRKSDEAKQTTAAELRALDEECERLGHNIKSLMNQRKTALTEKELRGKQETLNAEVIAEKAALEAIRKAVRQADTQASEITTKAKIYQRDRENLLAEVEEKVIAAQQQLEALETNLAAADAREEEEFQAKKSSLK